MRFLNPGAASGKQAANAAYSGVPAFFVRGVVFVAAMNDIYFEFTGRLRIE